MNKEDTHVHIYKRGRRNKSRIPGKNYDLDYGDFDIAKNFIMQTIVR